MLDNLVVANFSPSDQFAVRALLEASMSERWSNFDPSANPDIYDIANSFANGLMLVAKLRRVVIGCGGVLHESDAAGRIVRMCVAQEHRNKGIGTALLEQLIAYASARHCAKLMLETTATWHDAIAFYVRHGFATVCEAQGNRYFERTLVEA